MAIIPVYRTPNLPKKVPVAIRQRPKWHRAAPHEMLRVNVTALNRGDVILMRDNKSAVVQRVAYSGDAALLVVYLMDEGVRKALVSWDTRVQRVVTSIV